MSGIADWAEDALFDGALLFDGGDTGSRESIACFMHEGDRLGIVRDRGGYFRVEFLQKQPCRTYCVPLWSEARLSTLCATAGEGEALVREFLSAEHSMPSLGLRERAP
jgi:hypothetical protein